MQYPVSIYQRKGNCAVNRAHTSILEVVLNEADPFPHGGYAEQPLSFSFGVVLFVSGASMTVVDNSFGSY